VGVLTGEGIPAPHVASHQRTDSPQSGLDSQQL